MANVSLHIVTHNFITKSKQSVQKCCFLIHSHRTRAESNAIALRAAPRTITYHSDESFNKGDARHALSAKRATCSQISATQSSIGLIPKTFSTRPEALLLRISVTSHLSQRIHGSTHFMAKEHISMNFQRFIRLSLKLL